MDALLFSFSFCLYSSLSLIQPSACEFYQPLRGWILTISERYRPRKEERVMLNVDIALHADPSENIHRTQLVSGGVGF